jgi:hypothetical protein
MKWLGILLLALSAIPAVAQEKLSCYRGEGAFQKQINGFAVSVAQVPMSQAGVSTPLSGCHATVTDSTGKGIFEATDFGMSLALSGDTTLNGEPGVVFEDFSGGAHCCWIYYFVSLGKQPGLITKLSNQQGIGFEKDANGQLVMRSADGAFDYFDELCHACTPFPIVYFELKAKSFVDVSKDHIAAYDKQIADARAEVKPDRLAAFLKVPNVTAEVKTNFTDTIPEVLTIVFAYLYSGREAQAWQALDQMWPASDRERIRKLIVETRAKGILSQLGG